MDKKQCKEEMCSSKMFYGCDFYGTRLNMNPDTFSLCHEVQVGDQILGNIEELTVHSYNQAIQKLLMQNHSPEGPCRKCSKCHLMTDYKKKISYVTINTSCFCNSHCIYCKSHFGKENSGYNPIPYLENFYNENMFSEDCFFDWGGGEPTLNPYFEETVKWLADKSYKQRINTNAIVFSKETYDALKKAKASLRISVDSGTEIGYEKMKGQQGFQKVWANIKTYSQASNQIYIKYNICNYNSDIDEIDAFVAQCVDNNVKNILIDAEVSSYQPMKNAGPFYFTKKEFEAAKYLEKTCEEKGLNVQISGYAFSVRAEYDSQHQLRIPKMYYDNIDYDILSNQIYIQTFATIEYMIKTIQNSQKTPVMIWGAGVYGKKAREILSKHNIEIQAFIDINEKIQKKGIEQVNVISPKWLFESNMKCILILTGHNWKDMLKMINENNYKNCKVYYMSDVDYDEYLACQVYKCNES